MTVFFIAADPEAGVETAIRELRALLATLEDPQACRQLLEAVGLPYTPPLALVGDDPVRDYAITANVDGSLALGCRRIK